MGRKQSKVASGRVQSNNPEVAHEGDKFLNYLHRIDSNLALALAYVEHESVQPPSNYTGYVRAPRHLEEAASMVNYLLRNLRVLAYNTMVSDPLTEKDLRPYSRRDVEKMSQAFTRIPQKLKTKKLQDSVLWYHKNAPMFRLLGRILVQAPKTEEEGRAESIGGFDVHFMFHGDAAQDKMMRVAIEKCSQLVKSSDIPGYRKCLYGNVLVAGDVKGKRNLLAYYNPLEDSITMLSVARFTSPAYKIFLHELAHRLWRKFMPKDVQTAWARYHNSLGRAKRPEIGVVYELGQENLEVLEYVAPKFRVRVTPAAGSRKKSYEGYVDVPALMKLVGKTDYPTPYAATDPEEHFCDATAMYTLGTLKPDAVAAYERIVMGKESSLPLALTASAILRVANASLDPRTPVAEYLLSKGIVAVMDDAGDPQNSVSLPWSKGPNLANALNRIHGVTVHNRPVDGYVVVTVPHWKSEEDRRYMWKAVLRALRMELSHEITDEVLSWLRQSPGSTV